MRYPKRKLALFFTAQTLAIAVMGFLPRASHAWTCAPVEDLRAAVCDVGGSSRCC